MQVFVLLIAFLACFSLGNSNSRFPEKKLISSLLKNYEDMGTMGRPVEDYGKALEVSLSLSLRQILDLDYDSQSLRTSVWYTMQWKDDLLTWDPEDAEGIDRVNISPESIFIPDILPYNLMSPMQKLVNAPVVVSSNGDVTSVQPIVLTTSCSQDPTNGLEETIICLIKCGSWTYDGSKINLTDSGVDMTYYTANPEWNLVDASTKRNVMIYDCCPEPYIDVTYTFEFKSA